MTTNTPKGKLVGFIAIQKPSIKFDPNGVYSCEVEFEGKAASEMKKTIDSLMQTSLNNAKLSKSMASPPYKINGKKICVKFKQKAKIINKKGETWEKDIKVFDSQAKLVEENLYIGEGTEVIVNYDPYLWDVKALGAGITLQLNMVQIINLVKRDAATTNPFNEADNGFVMPKSDVDPFMPDNEEQDDDGDF